MTDVASASNAGERLRAQVAAHPFARRKRLTVSLGVAGFPEAGVQPGAIVGQADRALYAAKASGRNTVVSFSEAMQQAGAA
jgi:diguanylate cyclase (GGDEF)-like protein